MDFKAGDWFHNDEGSEAYVESVDGDKVYVYAFEPGKATAFMLPTTMWANDFHSEIESHAMKPGRFPAYAHLHIGFDDGTTLAPALAGTEGAGSETATETKS